MIKPKSIDHIVLRTDRYQELIAFYCNVIGCSLERETSDEFGLTQLRAGNSLIDIVDVNGKLVRSIYFKDIMGNNIELRSVV